MVRRAGVETRPGRKWSASQAVAQAESRLRHKDIVGTTAVGTQGLGSSESRSRTKTDSRTRREMVQGDLRQAEEEHRSIRAVAMGCQGAWTKWQATAKKMTWADNWRCDPLRISFLLRSVYDLLPSPANLHRWGKVDDPTCPLCGKIGTLEHTLSSCQTALTQGRYRWRHDKVLQELADIVERERRKKRTVKKTRKMQFVKEWETAKKQQTPAASILDRAQSWEMVVDMKRRLVFPSVVQTTQRPDMVIWSGKDKCLVIVELTVPWESRCEEAMERKTAKYSDLQRECKETGWHTWLFPVEVGVRGFPAKTLWRLFTALGLTGRDRKQAVNRLGDAAQGASRWLWLRREERS